MTCENVPDAEPSKYEILSPENRRDLFLYLLFPEYAAALDLLERLEAPSRPIPHNDNEREG